MTKSPRLLWYNSELDPRIRHKLTPKHIQAIEEEEYPPPAEGGGLLCEPNEGHPANLVSSLCEDGLHRPALDIDIPCRVLPSSTPGHCHIMFDTVALEWDDYVELLQALAKAGIVDQKYVDHSIIRKQTLLRTNGCTKQPYEGSSG